MKSSAIDSLQETVLRLIREVVPWQFAKTALRPDTSLQGDLGIDSLGKLSIAFRLEEEFGLELSEHVSRLGDVRTVADVLQFVRQVSQGKNA